MGEKAIILSVTPKPFVQIACTCEKVLRERDNVPSLIRIVDTYTIDPPSENLPQGVKSVLSLTVFVGLKSGGVVGEHEVSVRLTKPDGTLNLVGKQSLRFGGGESGVNVQIAVDLEAPAFGLYWFDVIWEDEILTKIPLRLKPKKPAESRSESTERAPNQPQAVS